MTEMPPARPSEPRTGPAAPAPAHGDGPTGPSAPTGRTEARKELSREIAAAWLAADDGDLEGWWEHAGRAADLYEEIAKRRAEEAERALAQARDAIATERRGRLAAEAAVRRVRELHAPEDDPRRVRDCKGCRTHVSFVPYEDCKTLAALDAEQPKETR